MYDVLHQPFVRLCALTIAVMRLVQLHTRTMVHVQK